MLAQLARRRASGGARPAAEPASGASRGRSTATGHTPRRERPARDDARTPAGDHVRDGGRGPGKQPRDQVRGEPERDLQDEPAPERRLERRPPGEDAHVEEPLEVLLQREADERDDEERPGRQLPRRPVPRAVGDVDAERDELDRGEQRDRDRRPGEVAVAGAREDRRRADPCPDRPTSRRARARPPTRRRSRAEPPARSAHGALGEVWQIRCRRPGSPRLQRTRPRRRAHAHPGVDGDAPVGQRDHRVQVELGDLGPIVDEAAEPVQQVGERVAVGRRRLPVAVDEQNRPCRSRAARRRRRRLPARARAASSRSAPHRRHRGRTRSAARTPDPAPRRRAAPPRPARTPGRSPGRRSRRTRAEPHARRADRHGHRPIRSCARRRQPS